MKFPTSINVNTFKTYKNNENLESDRLLKAENFDWDYNHPKSLIILCLRQLCDNWMGTPKLEDFVAKDRESFLQMLNTDVPLQILADNIKNNIFWKRLYNLTWSDYPISVDSKPWINIFMEKYYADMLENLNPRHYDPEKVNHLVKLCRPYIESLAIRSLIPADIPDNRIISPEMANLITSRNQDGTKNQNKNIVNRDHISMHAALGSLSNLVELHLTYQLRSCGANYRRDQFQFTNNDAKSLARGLEKCIHLKILRITRSDLNSQRLKYILRGISDNQNVETLDFSHCKLDDDGALLLAKFICSRERFRNLILVDNVIGPVGSAYIAHVLNHFTCGIRTLDLRLNNQLGSVGVAHIAVAVARGCNLISLNVSGCSITPEPLQKPPAGVWSTTNAEKPPTCGELLARAIGLVKTPLRFFDISVNNIGSPSDKALSNAICLSYLVDINLKRSGMSTLSVAVAESAAAAQKLRREEEKGIKFKTSAGRLVQAQRVVKGMNIDADPVLLAQQLSARPSIVSVASEEGVFNIQTVSLPADFGFIPSFQIPLESFDLPISGPSTSRRSSHHNILEPVKKVFRGPVLRRKSDGSIIEPRNGDRQRHVKISILDK